MKTLYILRGVSGSGKTTLAKTLESQLPLAVAFSADDYHYDKDGNYNFSFKNLNKAHQSCQTLVEQFLQDDICENVIVHNTLTTDKEVRVYTDLAEKYNAKVVSLVVENRHGNKNVHDVPSEVLKNQEKKLLNSIKLS